MPDALWIDAQAGASGDMLLGATVDLGADAVRIGRTLSDWLPDSGTIDVTEVRRAGLRATRCTVSAPTSGPPPRNLADIERLLDRPGLPLSVGAFAARVFSTLALAESAVHGVAIAHVHFHEVGAWDSIVDIVGTALALDQLELLDAHVTCSTVAVGSGTVVTDHGVLPVPVPATVAVLTAATAPLTAGANAHEACTPTGAALLATLASQWGPLPAMVVEAVGVGAGGRDTQSAPNVLRLLRGTAQGTTVSTEATALLETTVDDLDPRLWPQVLDALVAAGARDAWLTPVLMRKGRPGHVLSAVVPDEAVAGVRTAIFRHTSTLGVRQLAAPRTTVPRSHVTVVVSGVEIGVKIAVLDGAVVTVQPEYADLLRAADATGRPVRELLVAAEHAARAMVQQADATAR